MDNNQFSLELIKKFQQFFSHMDGQCQKFLKGQNVTIPNSNSQHKEHKIRDPEAPKKPMGAFFIFSNRYREKILERNPELKLPQIAQIAGNKWKAMSEEEKEPYQEQAREAKANYQKSVDAYNESHGIVEVEKKKKKSQKVEDKQTKQIKEQGDDAGDGDDLESESQVPNPAKKLVAAKQVVEKAKKKQTEIIEVDEVTNKKVKNTNKQKVIGKQNKGGEDDDIQDQINKFISHKESPKPIQVKKSKK